MASRSQPPMLRHPESSRLLLCGNTWGWTDGAVAAATTEPVVASSSSGMFAPSVDSFQSLRRLVLGFLGSPASRLFSALPSVEVSDAELDALILAGGSFTLYHLQRLNLLGAQLASFAELGRVAKFLTSKSLDHREQLFAYLNQHHAAATSSNTRVYPEAPRSCGLFAAPAASASSSSSSSAVSSPTFAPSFSWSDVDTLYVECLAGDATLAMLHGLETDDPNLRVRFEASAAADAATVTAGLLAQLCDLVRHRFLSLQAGEIARLPAGQSQADELARTLAGFEEHLASQPGSRAHVARQAANTREPAGRAGASQSSTSSFAAAIALPTADDSSNAYAYLSPLVSLLSSPRTSLFRSVLPIKSNELVSLLALAGDDLPRTLTIMRQINASIERGTAAAAAASATTASSTTADPAVAPSARADLPATAFVDFSELKQAVYARVIADDVARAQVFDFVNKSREGRALLQASSSAAFNRLVCTMSATDELVRDTWEALHLINPRGGSGDSTATSAEQMDLLRALREVASQGPFPSARELAQAVNDLCAENAAQAQLAHALLLQSLQPRPVIQEQPAAKLEHSSRAIIVGPGAPPLPQHLLAATQSAHGHSLSQTMLVDHTSPSGPLALHDTLGYANALAVEPPGVGSSPSPSSSSSSPRGDPWLTQLQEAEASGVLTYLRSGRCHLLDSRDEADPAAAATPSRTAALASLEVASVLQRACGLTSQPSTVALTQAAVPRLNLARQLATILRETATWSAKESKRLSREARAADLTDDCKFDESTSTVPFASSFAFGTLTSSPAVHQLMQLELMEARFGSTSTSSSSASSSAPASQPNLDLLSGVLANRRAKAEHSRAALLDDPIAQSDFRHLESGDRSWLSLLPSDSNECVVKQVPSNTIPSYLVSRAVLVPRGDGPIDPSSQPPPSLRATAVELSLTLLQANSATLSSRVAAVTSLDASLRSLTLALEQLQPQLTAVRSLIAADSPPPTSALPQLQQLLAGLRAYLSDVESFLRRDLPTYLAAVHPLLQLSGRFYTALHEALRAAQLVPAGDGVAPVSSAAALHPHVTLLLPLLSGSFAALLAPGPLSAQAASKLHAPLRRLESFTRALAGTLQQLLPLAQWLTQALAAHPEVASALAGYSEFTSSLGPFVSTLLPFVQSMLGHLQQLTPFAAALPRQYARFVRPLLLPLLPLLVPSQYGSQ